MSQSPRFIINRKGQVTGRIELDSGHYVIATVKLPEKKMFIQGITHQLTAAAAGKELQDAADDFAKQVSTAEMQKAQARIQAASDKLEQLQAKDMAWTVDHVVSIEGLFDEEGNALDGKDKDIIALFCENDEARQKVAKLIASKRSEEMEKNAAPSSSNTSLASTASSSTPTTAQP